MRRATRSATASPSTANGTPASAGCERRTNVIIGCTDATAPPRLRRSASSSLVSAPLECNATLPFHSSCVAADSAARTTSASGTQNHINDARTADRSVDARAPTCFANLRALFSDAPREWAITASIVYPARRNATARTDPRFPAPTIATRGFDAMPRQHSRSDFPLPLSGLRKPDADSRKPLYCSHGQIQEICPQPAQQRTSRLLPHRLSWAGFLVHDRPRRGGRRRPA